MHFCLNFYNSTCQPIKLPNAVNNACTPYVSKHPATTVSSTCALSMHIDPQPSSLYSSMPPKDATARRHFEVT